MSNSASLAAEIRQRYHLWLERGVEAPQRHISNWASEIGHPCARYLVYLRTRGDERAPIRPEVAALYREGREHERDVRRVLDELGFDPWGSGTKFPENDYQLSGKGDVFLAREGKVGAEIKSCNPSWWTRINRADDMLSLGLIPTKWYGQNQAYIFFFGLNSWLLILKNKLTGLLKVVEVPPDWPYIERLTDRAAQVNRHVERGTLPDYTADVELCLRCPFRKGICSPPLDHGEGLQVADDPLVIEAAEDYVKHREAGEAWRSAESYLKAWLKARAPAEGCTMAVSVGPVLAVIKNTGHRVLTTLVEDEEVKPCEDT